MGTRPQAPLATTPLPQQVMVTLQQVMVTVQRDMVTVPGRGQQWNRKYR
ncbi:MAG: hypothetical protein V3U27_15800 [Candidatus Tectomicrobia bacterium]